MYQAAATAFVVYIVIGFVLAVVHDTMQRDATVKRRLIAFVFIMFLWLQIVMGVICIILFAALIEHLVDKFAKRASM